MKAFFKAVIITTFLGVVTRILGFLLKIYISRKIGAEALGYYQISLSAFFLLCSLVTSGLPLVISRKIARNNSCENKVVGAGLAVCLAITTIVILTIVFFPSLFSSIWGQSQSLNCLYFLLPAVLFTAVYVPFRGAFWGKKQFFTLGFIELLEQVIRFVCCIVVFSLVINLSGDIKASLTYTIACSLSSVIAILIYFKQGGKLYLSPTNMISLVKESTPIALVRIGTSMVSMLISVIFPAMLAKSGMNLTTAVSEFGVVMGMVFPLLTIPGTIIGSISVALLPELSSTDTKSVKKQTNQSISYSIIISLLLFPIFFILGDDIGLWLFGNELAGHLLSIGSFLLLPLGVSQITSAILNALNKERIGLLINIVCSILLILSVIFLPKYFGIYALLIGFAGLSILQSVLNLLAIRKLLTTESLKVLIKNLAMCIPACMFAFFVDGICTKTINSNILSIVLSSGVSVLSLLILLITFNMIDIKTLFPQNSSNNIRHKKTLS